MTNNSAIFDKEVFILEHSEQLKDAVDNRRRGFVIAKRTIDLTLSLLITLLVLS